MFTLFTSFFVFNVVQPHFKGILTTLSIIEQQLTGGSLKYNEQDHSNTHTPLFTSKRSFTVRFDAQCVDYVSRTFQSIQSFVTSNHSNISLSVDKFI